MIARSGKETVRQALESLAMAMHVPISSGYDPSTGAIGRGLAVEDAWRERDGETIYALLWREGTARGGSNYCHYLFSGVGADDFASKVAAAVEVIDFLEDSKTFLSHETYGGAA